MRIAQTAYAACTTTVLRNGHPLQRAYRDICAGNAHFLTAEQSLIDSGRVIAGVEGAALVFRSEEHTSELQSLMRISYAVFCLKKKNKYSKVISNTVPRSYKNTK